MAQTMQELAARRLGMTMPVTSTDVGPDGFVKKTETKDATSVADILERNEKELGYIHITRTVQGVTVEWSSARPTMLLSQFLRATEEESLRTEESGVSFSGLSEKEIVGTSNEESEDEMEREMGRQGA